MATRTSTSSEHTHTHKNMQTINIRHAILRLTLEETFTWSKGTLQGHWRKGTQGVFCQRGRNWATYFINQTQRFKLGAEGRLIVQMGHSGEYGNKRHLGT